MSRRAKIFQLTLILGAFMMGAFARPSCADELIEKAGVGIGLTAGNLVFAPAKAVSVVIGALSGALSFVVTGGNLELTRQIWQDTLTGPYYITPELAKKAIGERPLLEEKN
jgi:hypothetical protein